MAILQTVKESPHWYTVDGKPMHDADMRLARKLKLLPSVTTVLNVWPKPALENYKIESGILAALTLPRLPGEALDEFTKRVITDMNAHREAAAAFGKKLHFVCEQIATGRAVWQDWASDDVAEHARLFAEWQQEHVLEVLSTEVVVVSKHHGYAGTYDILARTRNWGITLLDYKTQGVRVETGPKFYDTWDYQLAAYKRGIEGTCRASFIDNRVSVIIDSNKPSSPAAYVWDVDESIPMRKFLTALELWREFKNYFYIP